MMLDVEIHNAKAEGFFHHQELIFHDAVDDGTSFLMKDVVPIVNQLQYPARRNVGAAEDVGVLNRAEFADNGLEQLGGQLC